MFFCVYKPFDSYPASFGSACETVMHIHQHIVRIFRMSGFIQKWIPAAFLNLFGSSRGLALMSGISCALQLRYILSSRFPGPGYHIWPYEISSITIT